MKYLIPLLFVSLGANAYQLGGDHHPRSMIGQDPITFEEARLCDDLQYQVEWGPLSNRRNNTGSVGSCNPSGICAVYWIDTDRCDVIEKMERPKRKPRPTRAQRIDTLKKSIEKCWSGEPMFGPMPSCEDLERMLWEEETR